ncbi:hypothetical protein TKK_0005384 [Trichogramma kaykai]
MSLKFIISLINEYGTIGELKSKLKISKNHEAVTKSDKTDEKIDLFNKLMSLSCNLLTYQNNNSLNCIVKTLICMSKYTSFFSEQFKDMHFGDFSKIEDVIFIGSLLLRLSRIYISNAYQISDSIGASSSQLDEMLDGNCTKNRGLCIAYISSFINHSCAPNIKRCLSEDMKVVYYATEPIASGTQLLDSYFETFYDTSSMNRKKYLEKFVCQCNACKEDWPPLFLPEAQKAYLTNKMKLDPITYLTEVGFIDEIFPLVEKTHFGKNRIDKDLLQDVLNMIDKAANVLPHPSVVRCILQKTLEEIYSRQYNLTMPFENCCST